jgi:hypothetical protein
MLPPPHARYGELHRFCECHSSLLTERLVIAKTSFYVYIVFLLCVHVVTAVGYVVRAVEERHISYWCVDPFALLCCNPSCLTLMWPI